VTRTLRAGILAAIATVAHAPTAHGLTAEPLEGTFSAPVQVVAPPDPADSRLFVVQKGGAVRIHMGGELQATSFISLEDRVVTESEQGLLSIAFAPDYPATPYVFVSYSAAADSAATPPNDAGDLVVSRFTVSSDPDTADPDSERRLLVIPHSEASEHYAGQLHFGPDGYLYISTGDAGMQGDPTGSAQSLGTLLGKVLRLDPLGGSSSPPYYAVPPDNPFPTAAPPFNAIWSYGFRNPWRFSFDRGTGDLVIGDVGQNTREEIDFAPASAGRGAGENFGWNCREGSIGYQSPAPGCDTIHGLVHPVFDYPHSDQTPADAANDAFGCAVIGGFVYRGSAIQGLEGRYLYTDFCNGDIRSQLLCRPRSVDDRSEGVEIERPSGFGQDQAGELYVTSVATGTVYRLGGSAQPSTVACPGPPMTPAAPATSSPRRFVLRAAIRRCKRRHRGEKRRKCIARARRKAESHRSLSAGGAS
jgi:glucose/arabinose dehydrogenase